jgi:DNA-binding NarL/FixJ family response regulator
MWGVRARKCVLPSIRRASCAARRRGATRYAERVVKVLIVDDHSLVSEGMALILKKLHPDAEAVCAVSFAEALEQLRQQTGFDLVLLDLGLSDVHDLSGLLRLRSLYPAIPVVVVSGQDDRDTVIEALDAGAMGFIPKSSPTPVLANALRLIFSGGIYVPPVVLLRAHEATLPHAALEPATIDNAALEALNLTGREVQVLGYLMHGLTNKLIARELDISDNTVRKHVTTVLRTLRVRNRTEAVLEAARRGFRVNPRGPLTRTR